VPPPETRRAARGLPSALLPPLPGLGLRRAFRALRGRALVFEWIFLLKPIFRRRCWRAADRASPLLGGDVPPGKPARGTARRGLAGPPQRPPADSRLTAAGVGLAGRRGQTIDVYKIFFLTVQNGFYYIID